MSACLECAALKGEHGPLLLETERFAVHPIVGGGAVPGWLIVAPRRHVEQLDALTSDELAELMPLASRVGAALRASTPCEKLYLALFAEKVPHLHVHLIARPPSLAEELRGPKIFAAEARADPQAIALVAEAVRAALRSSHRERQQRNPAS